MENQANGELHNQDDVNPTSQMDKIVSDDQPDTLPSINGTGGNRPAETEGTVVIKED
jgi:hypothetical protein